MNLFKNRNIDCEKLIALIDLALTEADNFVVRYYDNDAEPMQNTIKTLSLLRIEVENRPENINKRVLRAMCDISTLSVKCYEGTPLEKAISKIFKVLYDAIPIFKHLEPLRMDFGKQDPI